MINTVLIFWGSGFFAFDPSTTTASGYGVRGAYMHSNMNQLYYSSCMGVNMLNCYYFAVLWHKSKLEV